MTDAKDTPTPVEADMPPDFLPWRVNERSPAADIAQVAASDGMRLIADVYGDRCRERAALIVSAVNAYPLLNEAAEVLRTAPYLVIDVAVAEAHGEEAAVNYARQFAEWAPRVKALLAKLEGGE